MRSFPIQDRLSHSQALSQCKEYLGTHRDWKQIPMVNTAMAAKKVKEDGDKTQAAIASAYAGEKFGLKVLADKIYDNEANSTRFIIVIQSADFPLGCEEDQHFLRGAPYERKPL